MYVKKMLSGIKLGTLICDKKGGAVLFFSQKNHESGVFQAFVKKKNNTFFYHQRTPIFESVISWIIQNKLTK